MFERKKKQIKYKNQIDIEIQYILNETPNVSFIETCWAHSKMWRDEKFVE